MKTRIPRVLKWLAVVGLACSGAMASMASAALIDAQFNPGNATVQTGAAVLGSPGDTWNNLINPSGTAVVLNDVTGAATAVKLTYTAAFGGLDAAGSPMDAATTNLMQGFNSFNGATLALSGLQPSTTYQLALYGAGDQAGGDQGTTFTIPQTGPSVVGLTTETFGGTGDRKLSDGPGVAYALVTASSDASGNLNINVTYNSTHFSTAPVNGFQIATVPEPTTACLLLSGTVLLLSKRRNRTTA